MKITDKSGRDFEQVLTRQFDEYFKLKSTVKPQDVEIIEIPETLLNVDYINLPETLIWF